MATATSRAAGTAGFFRFAERHTSLRTEVLAGLKEGNKVVLP